MMEGLALFNDILLELVNKPDAKQPTRLKFVNQSIQPYSETIKNLMDYLETNLSSEQFDDLCKRINDLNEESQLCEMILELVRHSEEHMDRHMELFDEILQVVHKIQNMDRNNSEQFAESAIDKCCLLIYDSFQILRCIRKKIIEISKLYHVPYFYDTEEVTIRFRSSLLTTYKNLNTVMDDFSILNEALWYVRHYEYISGKSSA